MILRHQGYPQVLAPILWGKFWEVKVFAQGRYITSPLSTSTLTLSSPTSRSRLSAIMSGRKSFAPSIAPSANSAQSDLYKPHSLLCSLANDDRLDLIKPFTPLLPEVAAPESKVAFNQRLMWTGASVSCESSNRIED